MHPAIRLCHEGDRASILAIINAAAQAYRGIIPADRWHEPYMLPDELDTEMAAGVQFWGYVRESVLVGVMGLQPVLDVELLRHAYVLPANQRHGVGTALIEHLLDLSTKPMLVGTWSAATWAISFYQRHGLEAVPSARQAALLKQYWKVPDWQIEVSTVLRQAAPKS